MKVISYTDARATLASVLDTAVDDLEEVVVTRAGHPDAVILARSEYESLMETYHLLRNPANARHLLESAAQLRKGQGISHELVEADT